LSLLCLLFSFGLLNPAASGEEVRSLSLAECLSIALTEHPSLRRAEEVSREQRARLESLRVNDRATFGASASYGYSDASEASSSNSWSGGISGSKTLYDAGRNRLSKGSQKLAIRQAGESEAEVKISVSAEVKRAYSALLLAEKNVEVAEVRMKNLSEHLERAQGYYEVGTRPKIDVTKAETDLADARVSKLEVEAEEDVAREALLLAMGLPAGAIGDFALSTPLSVWSGDVPGPDEIADAVERRPDVTRSLLDVEAAKIAVQSAALTGAPTVSATTGGAYSGQDFPLRDSFSAGLRAEFALYDAGERRADIETAEAKLGQSEASLETLRRQAIHEARSRASDLRNALVRAAAAEETLRYAGENLDLAKGRYDAGAGSPLEISDAVSDLAQAMYTRYKAVHDTQAAAASLEEAMGIR
jgi:outer membrane protein TolC